jgi:hypothetical protein
MSHDDTRDFRRLLRRSALGLLLAAALVSLCYFFVDKPVAFFVRDHEVSRVPPLRWLTETAMLFNALAPLLAAYSSRANRAVRGHGFSLRRIHGSFYSLSEGIPLVDYS